MIQENNFLSRLKSCRDNKWAQIKEDSNWVDFIINDNFSKDFYAIYLIETYHYVKENPRHQALVAVAGEGLPPNYFKFCYEHAEEETGHELMALHDLNSLGYTVKKENIDAFSPLTETELLIAYLYYISQNGNPLRRVGYSFWAEDSYQYIQDLLKAISNKLNLSKENMTFLVSHSSIDEKHSAEIEEIITKFCKTEKDFEDILEVMTTTIELQAKMLEAVVNEYKKYISQKSNKYSMLRNTHEVLS